MRSKQPIEFVYLYLSAEQGLALLETGLLNWSAPHTWHNPFELTQDTDLPFAQQQLKRAVLKGLSSLIFGPQPPEGIPDHPIPKAVQRWRTSQRFISEEEVEQDLGKIVDGLISQQQEALETILEDWRNFYRSHRYLRLFKENKNAQLWRSYADNFRGMAFKFDVSESDSSFAEVSPVKYQTEPLVITKLSEQVDHILGMREANPQRRFKKLALSQPKELSAEKEIRACMQVSEEQQDWHIAMPFQGGELKAVYLGNYFPQQHIDKVKQLLNEKYYHAVLYQLGIDDKLLALALNRLQFK